MAISQKCVSPKNLHDSNCKTKLDDIIKMAISQKCVKQKSLQDTAILVLHYPQLQFARVGAAAQDGHQPRVHLGPFMGAQTVMIGLEVLARILLATPPIQSSQPIQSPQPDCDDTRKT